MTGQGWLQILIFLGAVVALTRPLGTFLFRVFEREVPPMAKILGPLERLLYRFAGVERSREQTWRQYAFALLSFSAVSVLVLYLLQRLQHLLPLNPGGLAAVPPDLAFNTAVSFATNTNWQAYGGESTMGHLVQMAGLAWQNFVSAAAGIGVALALARGLTRQGGPDASRTVGNFWVDLIRATLYVLLPLSVVAGLALASQGVLQNLSGNLEVTTLEGGRQVIAMGPVASQEAIKELGTNGGGFFNANSAHPFENPSGLTNFLELVLILSIPAALTHTFGLMARDPRQGWVLLGAMCLLFVVGVAVAYWAESQPNPAFAGLPVTGPNMEGKEVRFGISGSVLFAAVTTAASCGAVNSMHDSFTPLGGLVPLLNIQLGEVIFGGVGAGLYGILIMALLSVFIAGLMVGRSPEYLGKKVEAREMKAVMLYALIFPVVTLGFSAWASASPSGVAALDDAGPHGLTEILYAFTSAAGNNGSAFAGLDANRPFYNVTLGLSMLAGRFLMIVPALAIAGSMAAKRTVPTGPGTFPTHGALFAGLLAAVILTVGALTFFPALALGPVVEHFLAAAGRRF